jgi:hypothetical protein
MIWERERRRVWFLRGREVSPPSSRWCFLPLVSLWAIMVFCLPWFVPVRVLFPPVSFRWWCLFLIAVGAMDFGYLCFCCCSTFVLTDTFRLSRLGSDLCSWSPGFLFRHIYVDTSEILRHDPPVFVRRQPLFLPPQQPAILNSHARNVVCTRWGFGLHVRATFHFSGQRGGVFRKDCWLAAAGVAGVRRVSYTRRWVVLHLPAQRFVSILCMFLLSFTVYYLWWAENYLGI